MCHDRAEQGDAAPVPASAPARPPGRGPRGPGVGLVSRRATGGRAARARAPGRAAAGGRRCPRVRAAEPTLRAARSCLPVRGNPVTDMPNVTHQTAEVNGLRTHFVEAGAGPPVLLLHGFPETWFC